MMVVMTMMIMMTMMMEMVINNLPVNAMFTARVSQKDDGRRKTTYA